MNLKNEVRGPIRPLRLHAREDRAVGQLSQAALRDRRFAALKQSSASPRAPSSAVREKKEPKRHSAFDTADCQAERGRERPPVVRRGGTLCEACGTRAALERFRSWGRRSLRNHSSWPRHFIARQTNGRDACAAEQAQHAFADAFYDPRDIFREPDGTGTRWDVLHFLTFLSLATPKGPEFLNRILRVILTCEIMKYVPVFFLPRVLSSPSSFNK